ncbi:hypothetical protein C2857_003506 [Epichloe festucae Fl1]|uniref:Uncharacterized protein n=1 Tax=Epichloe festucae (strain Fl1) TaxID=877507 RepID=A0A7U3SN48_EPIFF|nr:hypothetical protein C2857_003506 [Epichloe festucae Fl1]
MVDTDQRLQQSSTADISPSSEGRPSLKVFSFPMAEFKCFWEKKANSERLVAITAVANSRRTLLGSAAVRLSLQQGLRAFLGPSLNEPTDSTRALSSSKKMRPKPPSFRCLCGSIAWKRCYVKVANAHIRVLVGLLGLGVVEKRREHPEQAFVIAADDEKCIGSRGGPDAEREARSSVSR